MENADLTAAAFHYRSGRYERAASILTECKPEEVENDNLLLSSLTKFALDVDVALCRFRSASSPLHASKYNASDRVSLLMEARRANRAYFDALSAVVSHLTCKPLHVFDNTEHLIDTNRVQLSMAILMNSVSMFWLLLHLLPDESEPRNSSKASMVIKTGVQLAAHCFQPLSCKSYMNMPTWSESFSILERVSSFLNQSETEDDESTRMLLCLDNIYHVISISNLQNDSKLFHPPRLLNKNNNTESQHVCVRSANQCPELACHNLLVQVLHHRLEGGHKSQDATLHEPSAHRVDSDCTSKEYYILKEAIEKYDSAQAKMLLALLLGIDTLQTHENDSLNWVSAIDSLKPFAQRSPLVAHIIASLHIKKSDYKNALQYLYQVLSMNDVSSEFHLNVSSDAAMCFAKLGEPEPVVELLLHWMLTLDEMKHINRNEIDSIKVLLTSSGSEISSPSTASVLWRLLFASELIGDSDTSLSAIKELSKLYVDLS